MATRVEIAQQFLEAQRSRDAAKIDAVGASLTDDAVLNTPRGAVSGKAAILDRLKNPPQGPGGGGGGGGGMMGQITFADAVEDGGAIKIAANIPAQAQAFIKGLAYAFNFNDSDQINKIDLIIDR